MLYRNENYKIDLGVKIILKDLKNYIDNVWLVFSLRKLFVLMVDIIYIGRIFLGLLSINIGVSFGLERFVVNKDKEEWFRNEYILKV